MIRSPFSVFAPFADRLSVVLWTKADPCPHACVPKTPATPACRHDVCGTLGVKEETSAEQVHGNVTTVIRRAMQRAPGVDGLVTDRIGLALSVRTADCQSFVIYAPERNVVGVLHVGWRGLSTRAIPEFFETLRKEWNIQPKDTWVAAGPSLCQKCADFTDPKRELPALDPAFIHGKWIDLRGAADEQLRALGVPRAHFERHPDCTRCHPERYWTYRGGDREAVKAGQTNLLAVALLPVVE